MVASVRVLACVRKWVSSTSFKRGWEGFPFMHPTTLHRLVIMLYFLHHARSVGTGDDLSSGLYGAVALWLVETAPSLPWMCVRVFRPVDTSAHRQLQVRPAILYRFATFRANDRVWRAPNSHGTRRVRRGRRGSILASRWVSADPAIPSLLRQTELEQVCPSQ
jgi:hypothetical protein